MQFNTVLDVSNFDTSKVTDTSYMFARCRKIKTLDLSSFNTEKVTTFAEMFSDINNNYMALEEIKGLENLTASNCTRANLMFSNCNKLKVINLSNFQSTKLSSTTNMFYNCSSLVNIYIWISLALIL